MSRDEFAVLRVDGLTVASGWQCGECGLIRAADQYGCICRHAAARAAQSPAQQPLPIEVAGPLFGFCVGLPLGAFLAVLLRAVWS